jgi:hypothetical protein
MGMARPGLKGRQFTIYAPSREDLKKWKELCKPMTLNGWIMEMIERGVEEISNPAAKTRSSDNINDLRKEILELKRENKRLVARISEIEGAFKSSRIQSLELDQNVVEFLKKGGILKSVASVPPNQWTIVDAISEKEKRFEHEPNESEITEFKDGLGYTSIKIILKDDANKTLIVRPSDRVGGMDINEIKIRRAKIVSSTLDQLENLGLARNTRVGWRWTKQG